MDEALLSSGRVSDAVQSLHEWLQKAEAYLSEDQPILGDLDTVTILCEQHKVMYLNLGAKTPSLEAKATLKIKAILVSNEFSTFVQFKTFNSERKTTNVKEMNEVFVILLHYHSLGVNKSLSYIINIDHMLL